MSENSEGILPEMAERILDADFKNIVKKVAAGKTLTVAERSRVQARASGCSDSVAYAKTVVELANLLGVTRRTITGWRKMEGAPEQLANGSFPVADWREFVRVRGLKTNQPVTTNEEALKARKLLAEVEERELKVALKKQLYVSVEEVRRTWTAQAGRATALLRAKFESELPPILSGLDATGIQEECRRAIDEVLTILHTDGV